MRDQQAALDPPINYFGDNQPEWEMSFEDLCENMAAEWISNGGDEDGFDRAHGEIRGWIVAKLAERGRLKTRDCW